MIRALIFDFDGLIVDTEEPIYRSWLEVYAAHGQELPFDRWVQTVGSTNQAFHPQQHLEEKLGHPLPEQVLQRRVARRTELVLAQPLLPGVVDLVDAARSADLRLGVASSSTREWVAGHLGRLGILERFDCLRCRDDVLHAKPEPDLYIAVLDCLGLAPGEAVAIEDSPNGIAAAKRAGLRCIAIPNPITARLDLSEADLLVESLAGVRLSDIAGAQGTV